MGSECSSKSQTGRTLSAGAAEPEKERKMKQKHCTAVVLAAGKGSRMGTAVAKQYLKLGGHPVVAYALQTFENSPLIDDIILMTGEGQEEYCRRELVQRYGWKKVREICAGGKERYESVWKALQLLTESTQIENRDGYVFIHDGARPFLTEDVIERTFLTAQKYGACAAGMPVKDTIKLTDENGVIIESPDRSRVWQAQTPQVFSVPLIMEAFRRLMQEDPSGITDDAMVVESRTGTSVHMAEGSYRNIKITTPEDLSIAESILRSGFAETIFHRKQEC